MFTDQTFAKIDLKSIMGMWLFDEGKGDAVKDLSGNRNDGKINSAKWVEGKIGKALEFDSTGSVEIPNNDSLNNVSEITIVAWVYLKRGVTSGTWNALVGKNPYTNGYLMWIEVPQEPCSLVYVGGRFDNRSGVQIDLNRWYHLAYTRALKGEMNFYIDGALVKVGTSPQGAISTIPGPLSIAGQSPQVLDGLIDEVAIFNVVLTADDIKSITTKGLEKALGLTAVSPAGKLATVWGVIKAK